jgi:hypothetical protein
MNVPGFTTEALETVNSLLFAEGQVNPHEGKCNQRKLRERAAKPRTPLEQQADKARSVARQGKPVGGGADRSEAARKAAATKARCKGGSPAQPPSGTTVV